MSFKRTLSIWSFVVIAAVGAGSLISEEEDRQGKILETKGFRFRGGDPEKGREAFAILSCNQCHSVANSNVPDPRQKRRINLELAAEMRFVKKYEDLILAITSPRHVINEQYRAIISDVELQGELKPFMTDLTDHMSARQLMDLTSFLHQIYARELPEYGKPAAAE